MGVDTIVRPPASPRADPPRQTVETSSGRSDRQDRSAMAIGFGLALLAHLLVFLLVRFTFHFTMLGAAPNSASLSTPATQVIDLVAVADGAVEEPEPLALEGNAPAPLTPVPVITPGASTPPTVIEARPPVTNAQPPARAGDRSVADRLAPTMGDPRLWSPPTAATPPISDLAAASTRIGSVIAAYNDSIASAEAAAARRLDWTVDDGKGGKWGVSPGALHLGSVTIPLPIGFATPPDRRDELNRRVTDWTAIQAQRARADVEARIKERANEKKRLPPPDTSKSRR